MKTFLVRALGHWATLSAAGIGVACSGTTDDGFDTGPSAGIGGTGMGAFHGTGAAVGTGAAMGTGAMQGTGGVIMPCYETQSLPAPADQGQPESIPASECAAKTEWDPGEVWNNYSPGDERVHDGQVWSCHTPPWCQVEPGGENSDLGWTEVDTCEGNTGTGGGNTGGTTGAGGTVSTGGASAGGAPATGGAMNTGGGCSGGAPGTGGTVNTGGAPATGGATNTGGTVGNTGGSPPVGGCVLDRLMPGQSLADLFKPGCGGHMVNPVYTNAGLCEALETPGFEGFASSGNDVADKRELAAFFAHAAKETWWLHYAEQQGSGDTYRGRGPIQLTHSYNYEAAGNFLGINLMDANASKVATDPVITWQAALWFWMVQVNTGASGEGNPHKAMLQNDFGQTTRIINGGIECGSVTASACKRADMYIHFCTGMGLSESECTNGVKLTCVGDWNSCSGIIPTDC